MARVWVWSQSFHQCGPRTRAHLNGQNHFTAHVARMGADHATSGAVRATKDVDFLVSAEAADRVHVALLELGYQCLYRSEDAAYPLRNMRCLLLNL